MAKFDAASIEDIEWDFTKFIDGAKGIVPEPSQDQLSRFRAYLADSQDETESFMNDDGTVDRAKLKAYYAERGGIAGADAQTRERQLDEIAAVCNNVPDRNTLSAVPPAVFSRFAAWLTELLLDPSKRTADTTS